MIPQSILDETKVFLEHLGLSEEPFGVYYSDIKPEKAFGPKPGPPSRASWKKRVKWICRRFSNIFPA
jgi:hypothetical protein